MRSQAKNLSSNTKLNQENQFYTSSTINYIKETRATSAQLMNNKPCSPLEEKKKALSSKNLNGVSNLVALLPFNLQLI